MRILVGSILVILAFISVIPASTQTPDYHCKAPVIMWGGQLWKIETTDLIKPPSGNFNGRLINENSIVVTADYLDPSVNPQQATVNPLVILRTKDALYLFFSYSELLPYGSDQIEVFVEGELEIDGTTYTFLSFGPGPGFMRRP
jgi:hypothetical protein